MFLHMNCKYEYTPHWSMFYLTLQTDTPDTVVFYTLNGRRPEPVQHHSRSHTFTYKTPFALNPGKVGTTLIIYQINILCLLCVLLLMGCAQVTIKALAWSKDGLKQSSVVTKTFVVHEATEASDESEDETVRVVADVLCIF